MRWKEKLYVSALASLNSIVSEQSFLGEHKHFAGECKDFGGSLDLYTCVS